MSGAGSRGRVTVGQALESRIVLPTRVQLFRFSAATANPHRIHYDQPFARSEGHPDVVVQSHLHASLLAGFVLEWAGENARLIRFRWRNRAVAVADQPLMLEATVAAVEGGVCTLELTVSSSGRTCVTGTAAVALGSDRPRPGVEVAGRLAVK